METAASLLAFIEITVKVIGICKNYIESIKNAPHTLHLILVEISSLRGALESLQFLRDVNPELVSKAALNVWCKGGTLDACEQAVIQLSSLLPDQNPDGPSADSEKKGKIRQQISQVFSAATWPHKEEKTQKLLQEISRHKATITLALSTDMSRDIKGMRAEVKEVQEVVTGTHFVSPSRSQLAASSESKDTKSFSTEVLIELICIEDSERRKFYEWLESTNPSRLHIKAAGLHEDETGLWALELEHWRDWVARTTRCVWIHGIPGAGKTIMVSFLFDTINRITGASKTVASVYYYCYFGHNQDETNPLLGWIVSQLCRRARQRPQNLLSIYEIGIQPTDAELLEGLADTLDSFTHVYVVIDALDESKEPREKLLTTLMKIATEPRFNKIQLLVTSREYLDIRWVLSDFSASVAMQPNEVQVDTRTRVTKLLRTDRRFSRWPEGLRRDVQDKLAVGAKGMFRWVDCQIDILRRLRSNEEVEEALSSLPEGLYETYERIFDMIPEYEHTYVKRTLSFLCAHDKFTSIPGQPMIPSALLPLVTENWKRENSQSSRSDLYDLTMLEEACGCLVTFGKSEWDNDVVYLAHYTVKEFLLSERRNTNSNAISRLFALSPNVVDRTFLEATLAVILEYTGPLPRIPDAGHVYDYVCIGAFLAIEHRLKDLRGWKLDSLVLQMVAPQGKYLEKVVERLNGDEEARERLTKVFHALE